MSEAGFVMSNERKKQFLQKKVSFTLLAVMAVLAIASYAILNAVIAPAFDELELDAARTNMIRFDRAIDAELDNLGLLAADWGRWDDAYFFVQDQLPSFRKSNLGSSLFSDLEIDLMLYYDESGDLYWGRLLVQENAREVSSSGVFESGLPIEAQLTRHETDTGEIRGLLQTAQGPMLIFSVPITTTDRNGSIVGALVIGRFLDDVMLAQIRQRTEEDLAWQEFGNLSGADRSEIRSLLNEDPVGIHFRTTVDTVHSYHLRRDLNDQPIMLLQADMPRRISALGQQTLNGALLLLASAALVVALVIWLLLRNMIVKPLETVATHISGIRESGDLSKRMTMKRGDEIGTVADNLDEMAGELDDARKMVVEQSFKAGKADTAAEVMHNIRNAMTPLINGIDRLDSAFRVTEGLKIGEATQQIADPECLADRNEKLLQYINSAFEHVENSHADGRDELVAVSKQARLVEDIISDQERHAKGGPVIEDLELDDVLDEAVLVIPKRSSPSINLSQGTEISQFRVQGHRVGLLQVLGNIILNAYESIQRSQSDSGSISLSASNETIDDQEMIRLVVSDTGCGFDDINKHKIFQRGYSSKSGSLSGLGLHWCANALAAMGGRIQAQSKGEGQGAEFHVLLPAALGG
jgi:sensor domain CHASE-containing protein